MEKISKYQILEKVGQGGMGVVYKALDPLIERVVAVKVVSSDLEGDPEWRERFFREGRAAGRLSHKNIVTIFDLGEDAGSAYMAMEYLEGEDLRRMILRGEQLTLENKIQIMRDVCEGLAHAHERNVIHRDIKPANILITRAGQAKILDFGLARRDTSDLTNTGEAIGTANYMSPEQVRGEKVDRRTDVFSAGALFYELLTYRKAFKGDSFMSTIYKILQEEPERIENVDTAISPGLSAIVYKALAKNRQDRFQSIGEMLAELNACCGAPVQANGRTDEGAAISDAGMRALETAAPSLSGSRRQSTSRKSLRRSSKAKVEEDATQIETPAATPPAAFSGTPRYVIAASLLIVLLAGSAWFFARYQRANPEIAPKASISPQPDSQPPPSAPEPAPPLPAEPESPAPQSPAGSAPLETGDVTKASAALKAYRFSEAAREAQKTLDTDPNNEGARAVLQTARKALDTIRTGMDSARSFSSAGDFRQARAALAQVLKVAPYEAEALQLLSTLNRLQQQNTGQALAQMKDAKSGAEKARASELAPQTFSAAGTTEQEGNSLNAAGRFEEAAVRLAEAAELYRRSEREARNELAARSETVRAAETQRQQALLKTKVDTARQDYERERDLAARAGAARRAADQFAEAEKQATRARNSVESGNFDGGAREYDSALAAMRQARLSALEAAAKEVAAPAETPKPAAPPPAKEMAPATATSAEVTQKEIYSLPERYKEAMENQDLNLLKTIWPTMGRQQEQAFRNQWEYTRSLRMTLSQPRIAKLEGDSALVTVRLSNEQLIDNGTVKKWDQQATFSVSKSRGSWVIEGVNFELVR